MKTKKVKKILLILLIVTVLISAYFNITEMIKLIRIVFSSIESGEITIEMTLGQVLGSIFSYFNLGLFIYIILVYDYKKINFLWILLPYFGSIIFGTMKLIEMSVNEKA